MYFTACGYIHYLKHVNIILNSRTSTSLDVEYNNVCLFTSCYPTRLLSPEPILVPLREGASVTFDPPPPVPCCQDLEVLGEEVLVPAGSGDAATDMGRAVVHWKRFLGLAVPAGWTDDYAMPTDPPLGQMGAPLICKLLNSLWVMTVVMMLFTSIGLQWAFCRQ